MSAVSSSDPLSKSAAKKKRKNKKKANDKAKDAPEGATSVNAVDEDDNEPEVDEAETNEDTPQPSERVRQSKLHPHHDASTAPFDKDVKPSPTVHEAPLVEEATEETPVATDAPSELPKEAPHDSHDQDQEEDGAAPEAPLEIRRGPAETLPLRNGVHESEEPPVPSNQPKHDQQNVQSDDNNAAHTTVRLQEMTKERNDLQAEVAKLRRSLESVQEKHQGEVTGLREEVEDAQSAKENAESQYRTLLGKVNTIRSQLGERLKADAEELSQARSQIEELQDENRRTNESNKELQSTVATLQAEIKEREQEIVALTSQTGTLHTNWTKERDELLDREAFARDEFESAKQAMQDWEVLAMEERSLRESLGDKVVELEDQLNAQQEAYARVAGDRDSQSSTIDGLQSALQEIQEARRRELRELVENSQSQLDALRAEAETAKTAAATSAADLETAQKELERALPFEKEVKEKNLLIGKLRHEAVILNDHLTKALRFLKRGKPEDNVDRQIVTNHFLQFLQLDRSDPKKFQVLQLIAALLGWNEEQRERAGLARPGASNSALRVPLSPFRRTPSTPTLSTDFMPENAGGNGGGGSSKESLAELWSEFLDREAQEGKGGPTSRASSVAGHSLRSPLSPTDERQAPGLGISRTGTWGSNH